MMNALNVCPSTLEAGHATYSPSARKRLFDGQAVSHVLPYESSTASGMRTALNDSRKRLSLSGAQAKYPMTIDGGALRLTEENETGTFILKPMLTDFEHAEFGPANEHLTMQIAGQVFHMPTAANALCFFRNGEAAYLTRRYDINADGSKTLQEDFASLAGVTSETHGRDFKYDALTYEELAGIVRQYISTWRIDLVRFYDIILFNFLFANGDAHIKNFSVLRRPNGDYGLAPAYDLINTQLHLPDDSVFALSRGLFVGNDQHKELNMNTGRTFGEFGVRIGLSERIVDKELQRFCGDYPQIEELVSRSFLSDFLKAKYLDIYHLRKRRLSSRLDEQ